MRLGILPWLIYPFSGHPKVLRARDRRPENHDYEYYGNKHTITVSADVWLSRCPKGERTSRIDTPLIVFLPQAIEHVSPEEQSLFVSELADSVLRCVKDANGNHVCTNLGLGDLRLPEFGVVQVVQRLIESVPPERLTFVSAFQGHVNELATHPYGCRVLQRCFENLPDHQTRALLTELQDHSLGLMQDQFGVSTHTNAVHGKGFF